MIIRYFTTIITKTFRPLHAFKVDNRKWLRLIYLQAASPLPGAEPYWHCACSSCRTTLLPFYKKPLYLITTLFIKFSVRFCLCLFCQMCNRIQVNSFPSLIFSAVLTRCVSLLSFMSEFSLQLVPSLMVSFPFKLIKVQGKGQAIIMCPTCVLDTKLCNILKGYSNVRL